MFTHYYQKRKIPLFYCRI